MFACADVQLTIRDGRLRRFVSGDLQWGHCFARTFTKCSPRLSLPFHRRRTVLTVKGALRRVSATHPLTKNVGQNALLREAFHLRHRRNAFVAASPRDWRDPGCPFPAKKKCQVRVTGIRWPYNTKTPFSDT